MEEEGAGKFRIEISKGLFKRGEIKINLGNYILQESWRRFQTNLLSFPSRKKKGKLKLITHW